MAMAGAIVFVGWQVSLTWKRKAMISRIQLKEWDGGACWDWSEYVPPAGRRMGVMLWMRQVIGDRPIGLISIPRQMHGEAQAIRRLFPEALRIVDVSELDFGIPKQGLNRERPL